MRQRGWLCSCEILIVSLSNFRRHLSVRSGAKHVPLLENLVKNIKCLPRVLVAAGRLSAERQFYGVSRKFHPQLHSQDLHSRPTAATAVEIFLQNLMFWVTISPGLTLAFCVLG